VENRHPFGGSKHKIPDTSWRLPKLNQLVGTLQFCGSAFKGLGSVHVDQTNTSTTGFPEICWRAPFGTGVKEPRVHLNISSLLLTPQTVPSEPADTYFSSPAIWRQPLPVQVKIWFLALTPQIFFEFPTEICLRAPFGTGVKEPRVHLNISSLLLTPQTVPSEPADILALPLFGANHYRSK
jgi:hypothetical protein